MDYLKQKNEVKSTNKVSNQKSTLFNSRSLALSLKNLSLVTVSLGAVYTPAFHALSFHAPLLTARTKFTQVFFYRKIIFRYLVVFVKTNIEFKRLLAVNRKLSTTMLWKLYHRLTYLNKLIKQKATGSPKELAKKLCITERAWYKFRDELVNDLHLPIDYCPHSRSYVYTEEGSFEIGFRKLSKNESEQLNGGKAVLATLRQYFWQKMLF